VPFSFTSTGSGAQGPQGEPGQDATLPQSLASTDSPTFVKIVTSSNGSIENVKFGDDAYLGDGNLANHLIVKGQQTATLGGIAFGSGKTEKISTDATNLSLNANNDIILNPGSGYGYIGTPTVSGSTRIAKWSDTLIKKSSVPAHDHGATGDTAGMFAHDGSHFYVCIADYVNNSTVIWKRINWASGNW
jgi:hypothetical protein